ncbi:hypothetical protein K456DRAFT_389416 [Colletotrichum gloeosporioides 23]|nr:hypothetical protein K456DRAFT_389416 [Colletotrichum gloeosporioides 23]
MKSVDLRGLWPRVRSKSGAKIVSRTFLSPFVPGCDLQSGGASGSLGWFYGGGILGVFWGARRSGRQTGGDWHAWLVRDMIRLADAR